MKSLSVSERFGWARFVAHQAYYSLIGRDYEWELMPLAIQEDVGALVPHPVTAKTAQRREGTADRGRFAPERVATSE